MMRSRRWPLVAAAGVAACAIGLGAVAGAASSKTTTPSGSYKGKTNNGLAVTFKIQSGKVRNFSATVHALCVSVAGPSYLDPVFHQITPQPMKLAAGGKFSAAYKAPSSTRANVDGTITGKNASGHYQLRYTATRGLTIYACQEKGTWKASRK